MPTALDILLARTRGDLPPVPGPATSAPIPLAPTTGIGPLSEDTTAAFAALNPEPVPPAMAPAPPIDTNFINTYAGAAPVAPTIQDPSTLARIGTILSAVSAGLQGQGPQFVANLRAEREAPIRRYEQQLQAYNERRQRGLELATRQQEREQDRAQRAAENQYEREFQAWVKKTGVRDAEAQARLRQAFEIQKIREAERIADEKQAEQERKQLKLKAADIAKAYRLAGAGQHSNELAERDLGLRDNVSPAADKWLSAHVRLEQARADRAAGLGGGTGGISSQTAKLVEEFNTVRQNLITATARGDAKGQKDLRLRLTQLVKRLAGRPGVEAGYGAGQWPYIKVNGVLQGAQEQQQQPAGGNFNIPSTIAAPSQGQTADPLGIR